ncbi:uncharacterized protein CcaverHIS019_0204120 [Cutaneotrichosporon cavernicola]|uniref:AAA+ ATPase domain-containing protein n=1 Tax=Cutaneotrichosporon cavernicola TaxID=279322 RepID=A0AA48I720_9TREE|nr:uncharacterized protein CcaverHIS019_0204120 [Cutaneotrichosporon cavernicola]BEI89050.1 hypothetical protein CcaverHIS019_0204120 [Cutaneotrichosporon cavernicola]BEI96825.1 hypothetical protein CcaverHIS631_0204140 [Cutaneotrichosporon cavernicola]BEJ04597.1 hypothetical protein CcaverHIS641_0204140 [Cutaneotrichosporon cavernicola]
MPAPKRTRAAATAGDSPDNEDVDNQHRSDMEETRDQTSPATTTRVTRRTPSRRNVTNPPRPSPDATTPTRPTLRSTRATPSPGITRSASLFGTARPTNGAIIPNPPSFAGPSTRSAGSALTLVRASSTSAVPSQSQIKATVTGGGSAPPPVKGGAGDDVSGGPSRRPYKGKENIPPPKEPQLPTPPSEGSRKRLRLTPSSSRTRSASIVSVRSESSVPSLGSDLTTRTSSCLPSPSPSPSVATTISVDEVQDADRTPTKRGFRPTVPLTPPPSSPSTTKLTEDMMSMCSRTTTPLDDSDARSFSNAYRALKHGLRLSSSSGDGTSSAIIGRDNEKAILGSYLSLVSASDVGMYVSGPPGTGKTALTTAVGRGLAEQGWRVVEVSVMGLKPQDVWTRLGVELGCGGSEDDVIAHLKAKNTRTFIILDEIDSLLPPPPSLPAPTTSHVLSKLFSLPLLSTRGSTVKLVAISNTLDLTVRANLVLEGNAMPQVLPFKAYNATDMTAIVNARVDALGDGPDAAKVDAKVIELLCRKVEAQTGDLRMCLGVLSSAVGLAEADWVKKGSAPISLIKVALPHILKAFSTHTKQLRAAAGTTSSGVANATTGKIRSVPLNGRMVLVALLVWLMRTRAGLAGCPAQGASPELLTPSALYATYAHLLNHPSSPIKPSPESDYRDLLSNLETLGLVSLPRVRGGNVRVELCVREDEVRDGLALSAAVKAVGEEEVAQVWAREEARVARVCARAQAAVERAAHGLPMETD